MTISVDRRGDRWYLVYMMTTTTETNTSFELSIRVGRRIELETVAVDANEALAIKAAYATPNALELIEAVDLIITNDDGLEAYGPLHIDVAEIERNQARAEMRERAILRAADEDLAMGWSL